MSKLGEALRSGSEGGAYIKARDLVGQVITVVSYTPGQYDYRGKLTPKVDIVALDANGEQLPTVSGTATMLNNLRAAEAAGFELPLDLRIVAFPVQGGGTGYGLNDPDE